MGNHSTTGLALKQLATFAIDVAGKWELDRASNLNKAVQASAVNF